MKVVGFITEYNPFHNGHLYHLEKSKEISNSDFSISVMSGSFVQRGEPSLIDKWTKARMAIDNGIDLVIELPVIYSLQSAELFAYGGVKLLDSLGIVDYIAFGSEAGTLDDLNLIGDILVAEPSEFKSSLKTHLNSGNSYSVARSKAIDEYIELNNLKINNSPESLLKSSNNILAIEYIKALKKLNSHIKAVTFKRIINDYKNIDLTGNISSATAIRNIILTDDINKIKNNLPSKSLEHLLNYKKTYGAYNKLENYSQILMYLLRTINRNNMREIIDVETGLENRLKEHSYKYNDIKSVIDYVTTKRYPRTRIQRILMQLQLGLNKKTFLELNVHYPSYIRILGANEKGIYLIKKIKERSSLPIINKFSDYNKYKNTILNRTIEFDKKATDLFFMGLNDEKYRYANQDFYISPYIKKAQCSYHE